MLPISDVILLIVVCVWCTILVVAQCIDDKPNGGEESDTTCIRQ